MFWHVTAVNQSDYSIEQLNCRIVVACHNKFVTPPPVDASIAFQLPPNGRQMILWKPAYPLEL